MSYVKLIASSMPGIELITSEMKVAELAWSWEVSPRNFP